MPYGTYVLVASFVLLALPACAAPGGSVRVTPPVGDRDPVPDDHLVPDWSTVPATATRSGRPAVPLECADAVAVDPERETLLQPLTYSMRIPARALVGNRAWIRPDVAPGPTGRHRPFLRVGGSAPASGQQVYLTLGYGACDVGGQPVDPARVAVYRFRGSRFVGKHEPVSTDPRSRTVTVTVGAYTKFAIGSN
jgi:hypothetical protein